MDWPSSREDSTPTRTESFSQQQGTPLQFDLPSTDLALRSALVDLGFFPAVMVNIRNMLEEEERLLQERINARLPEIVSDTYRNFISTLNQTSNDGVRHRNSESTIVWHPIASNSPISHAPMNDHEAGALRNLSYNAVTPP